MAAIYRHDYLLLMAQLVLAGLISLVVVSCHSTEKDKYRELFSEDLEIYTQFGEACVQKLLFSLYNEDTLTCIASASDSCKHVELAFNDTMNIAMEERARLKAEIVQQRQLKSVRDRKTQAVTYMAKYKLTFLAFSMLEEVEEALHDEPEGDAESEWNNSVTRIVKRVTNSWHENAANILKSQLIVSICRDLEGSIIKLDMANAKSGRAEWSELAEAAAAFSHAASVMRENIENEMKQLVSLREKKEQALEQLMELTDLPLREGIAGFKFLESFDRDVWREIQETSHLSEIILEREAAFKELQESVATLMTSIDILVKRLYHLRKPNGFSPQIDKILKRHNRLGRKSLSVSAKTAKRLYGGGEFTFWSRKQVKWQLTNIAANMKTIKTVCEVLVRKSLVMRKMREVWLQKRKSSSNILATLERDCKGTCSIKAAVHIKAVSKLVRTDYIINLMDDVDRRRRKYLRSEFDYSLVEIQLEESIKLLGKYLHACDELPEDRIPDTLKIDILDTKWFYSSLTSDDKSYKG